MSNIFNSSSIFNSKEDLKDYIHDIHNFIRNNGAGYGKTGMKIFNIFYGLKLIEPHLDSLEISDDDKKILKFSNLIKKAKKKDSEITKYIDNDILGVLAKFKKQPNLVVVRKLLFHEIPKNLKDDFWRELINQINVIPVGYYEKDNESKVNLSGKVYEYFIGRDKSAISELGAFFTDRWITEFLITKVNPTVDENNDIPTIIDPFAGSGGFTLGIANYFREHFENIDWKDNVNNIFHFDMDEDVINMSGLEMFAITCNLPKIDDSNYKRVNSFAHEFDNKKYNYIFTNPPYGGDKIIESASQIKKKAIIQHMKSIIETEELKKYEQYTNLCEQVKEYKKNTERKVTLSSCSNRIKSFAKKYNLNSNDKEGCSLILLMDLLSENGTCCAVLKEGVFFDNSYADIRKVLIENFNITNIISIPSDAFESTTTKTSAIIFKNNGKTKKIKFSELLANKAKSNIIEKDENQNYFVKYLKDEIIDVYENELSTVTFEELIVPTIIKKYNNEGKKYDNEGKKYDDVERYDYSLNCKNYNKKEIVVGEGYELKKLGDIAKLDNGKQLDKKNLVHGIYPVYGGGSEIVGYHNEYNRENSTIISGTGNYSGFVQYNFNKFWASQCFTIKSEDNLINKWLYFYCKSQQTKFMDSQAGSAQKFIRASQFNNMLISIPKSKQKITEWVNKISKPYDKKNKNEELIMKLEEQIKNKIKTIEENEECDDVELGDITDVNMGATPDTKNHNYWENGNIPWVSVAELNNNIIYNTKKHITKEGENTMKNRKIPINSILLSFKLSIGKLGIAGVEMYCNEAIVYLNSKLKNVSNMYLYYMFECLNIEQYGRGTIGAHGNLNKDILTNLKIKLPKNKQLIKDFEPLFQQIKTLQTELKEAEELYKKLIKELSEEAIPSNKQIEEIEEIKVNKKKKKINETKNSEL
jgi:type I restriction enzyme S subunit